MRGTDPDAKARRGEMRRAGHAWGSRLAKIAVAEIATREAALREIGADHGDIQAWTRACEKQLWREWRAISNDLADDPGVIDGRFEVGKLLLHRHVIGPGDRGPGTAQVGQFRKRPSRDCHHSRTPADTNNHRRAQDSTSTMETDISTAEQSNNSAAKQSNEIRSLTDEELEVVSGGLSDFLCDVKAIILNAAILERAGWPQPN